MAIGVLAITAWNCLLCQNVVGSHQSATRDQMFHGVSPSLHVVTAAGLVIAGGVAHHYKTAASETSSCESFAETVLSWEVEYMLSDVPAWGYGEVQNKC